jgi:HSP20 family protein
MKGVVMTTRVDLLRSSALAESWPRFVNAFDALIPWDVDLEGHLTHSMRIEEFQRNGDLVVRAELPGCDPEKDIDIRVADGVLTISAVREEHEESERRSEFHYGRFVRSLRLPPGVDEDAVSAHYADGILEVCIAMPVVKTEAVRVPITRAA